jgi:hypothetical protein
MKRFVRGFWNQDDVIPERNEEDAMKDRNPIIHKSQRKFTGQISQVKAVSIRKNWPDGNFDHPKETREGLNCAMLYSLSRKGLWGLLIFLMTSVAAFLVQDFNLYQSLPEPVLEILGCPPPATLIHLALTGYSFTVVVPVLIRLANGDNPVIRGYHLPCRVAFYFFYLVSTTLPENFVAALTIGCLLYVVEQIGIWSNIYKLLHGAEASD